MNKKLLKLIALITLTSLIAATLISCGVNINRVETKLEGLASESNGKYNFVVSEGEILNNVKTDPSISFTVDDLVRRSTPEVSGDSLYQAFNYEELINSNKYTATFTKELQERMRTFTNLNDEQSTFDKSKIK